MALTREHVMSALSQVMDPEIPSLSIVDLGMVGDVIIDGESVRVDLVPTFLGCPALDLIQRNVQRALSDTSVTVRWVHDRPWSSSMISRRGRQALTEWGVAPPSDAETVACPFCGSHNTSHQSPFGHSLCKALYYCQDCSQPFEKIKTI